jgi:hypothetical protein
MGWRKSRPREAQPEDSCVYLSLFLVLYNISEVGWSEIAFRQARQNPEIVRFAVLDVKRIPNENLMRPAFPFSLSTSSLSPFPCEIQ